MGKILGTAALVIAAVGMIIGIILKDTNIILLNGFVYVGNTIFFTKMGK